MSEPRLRPAVRALILSHDERVLLVHFEMQENRFWATPGGGIEGDESELDALHRELREEVGLHDPPIVGLLWKREHLFPLRRWDGQRESIYLVRTPRFEPQPRMTVEELRAENVTEMRWWSVEELRASSDVFAPRALSDLLADLIQHGPPATPLSIGV